MSVSVGPPKGLLVFLWVVLGVQGKISSQSGWKIGRATYYGENGSGGDDGFSIHHGSCQYGQLDPEVGTGWDIAAISDRHPDFQGSCGKCLEIACESMVFRDNYGGLVDREGSCREGTDSVIVTIVDSCPCEYPKNAYNNKRWCCGDMDHFDLSSYAFHKLAPMTYGVIGIKYRPVPCPSYEDVMPTKPKIVLPAIPGKDEPEISERPKGKPSGTTSVIKSTAPEKQVQASITPVEIKAQPAEVDAIITPVPSSPPVLKVEQMSRASNATEVLSILAALSPAEESTDGTNSEGQIEFLLSKDVDVEKAEPKTAEPEESAVPWQMGIRAASKSPSTSSIIVVSSAIQEIPPALPLESVNEKGVEIERVSRVSAADTTPTTGIEYPVVYTPPVNLFVPIITDEPAPSSIKREVPVDPPTPTITTVDGDVSVSKFSESLPSPVWDVVKCSKQQEMLYVYNGGFGDCFTDGGLLRYEDANTHGLEGTPAWCTTVGPGRSIAALSVGHGIYEGKTKLSFSVMCGEDRPDISVSLVGTKGPCPPVHLHELLATKATLGYRTFFAGLASLADSESEEFEGCGPNSAEDVYALAFRNEQDADYEICIDSIKLY